MALGMDDGMVSRLAQVEVRVDVDAAAARPQDEQQALHRRQVSILVTTYARPGQLREALASIDAQDHSLIGEILVGDDSPPQWWEANRLAIADNALHVLIRYLPSDPPRGCYPNHWFLAANARFDHILFLHDDDHLCPGALKTLVDARDRETDERVKLWFGRNQVMDEHGVLDAETSVSESARYGKGGGDASRPMWQWCVTESVPPNSFLVERSAYLQHMRGDRDGNVGDFGFVVRLANSGAWARFLAQDLSRYRVQAASSTNSGRGVDAHLHYELSRQLVLPPEQERSARRHFAQRAPVAAIRYARDGERLRAWKTYLSEDFGWKRRLSKRGVAVLFVLLAPRVLWLRALQYRK